MAVIPNQGGVPVMIGYPGGDINSCINPIGRCDGYYYIARDLLTLVSFLRPLPKSITQSFAIFPFFYLCETLSIFTIFHCFHFCDFCEIYQKFLLKFFRMSEGSTITLFCRFWHFCIFTKSCISYDTNDIFDLFSLLGKNH